MKIPDYISPIIGHRVWRWNATGLKSLNGEPWLPGRPLAAGCRAASHGVIVGYAEAAHDAHEPPQTDCTCGIYASKSRGQLRETGYERYGICGEVQMWGTVVEHKLGWRAQFAYPKALYLPLDILPFTLAEIRSRLEALTLYGSDIFVLGNSESLPLWGKNSGFDTAGVDCLMEIGKEYYVRRQRERTLKKGDRVAVLGRGIAVVEQADDKEALVVLGNRIVLRIDRKEIVVNEQNNRWECDATKARGYQVCELQSTPE